MQEFLLYLYVCSLGFAFAGICASFSHLVTDRHLKFMTAPHNDAWSILTSVLVRIIAGPYLLVRNSLRGALIENRSAYWLALSLMFATLWSFFTGVIIVELLNIFSR